MIARSASSQMTLVIVSGRAYRTLEQHDRGPGIFQPGLEHLLGQYTQLTDAAASLIAARRALTAAP